jgi:predicted GTPase
MSIEGVSTAVKTAGKVTVLLVGGTGDGKSAFGNRYLGRHEFESDDRAQPVTQGPQSKSAQIGSFMVQVIDTEGHADGKAVSFDF